MSNDKIKFDNLPHYLSPQTLAQICVELSISRIEAMREGNTPEVVELERLHQFFWENLRKMKDLPQAITLINNAERYNNDA